MSLYITVGCPGAGKSTWAEKTLEGTRLRLERDRFRECLFGSRRAYHENEHPRRERSILITQAMLAAQVYWPEPDWAVTDTGIDYPAVEPFIDHSCRVGEPIKLFIFERPLLKLQLRNLQRPEEHRIPEDLLVERFHAFNDNAAWWRSCPYEKAFVA